jgi:hypothetical protein
MDFQILELINTVDDRDLVLREIDLLRSSLFQQKGDAFDSVLKAKVRSWVRSHILINIDSNQISKETYLNYLREELLKMDVIILELAFEPALTTIESFAALVKRTRGISNVLDIRYNPELIAGARISTDGKFKDMSMKARYEEVMKDVKKQFVLKAPSQENAGDSKTSKTG